MINTTYFNTEECHIQVNFVKDYEKWAKFTDEEKSTFSNPFHFSPLLPLPNNVVVEAMKINPAPLSEADRKTILKKHKEEKKKQTLKRRLSEVNDHQTKVKKVADLYKKSKSSEGETVFNKRNICIFYIEKIYFVQVISSRKCYSCGLVFAEFLRIICPYYILSTFD